MEKGALHDAVRLSLCKSCYCFLFFTVDLGDSQTKWYLNETHSTG